jgi:hypothetical protein
MIRHGLVTLHISFSLGTPNRPDCGLQLCRWKRPKVDGQPGRYFTILALVDTIHESPALTIGRSASRSKPNVVGRIAQCARWFASVAFVLAASQLAAQGVGTSTIRGVVRSDDDVPLDATVTVRSIATGVVSKTRARQGRYLAQGLEIGGPYVVEVQSLGFASQRSLPISLSLGQAANVDFILERLAVNIDTVTVAANRADLVRTGGGTAKTIPGDVLHRLPTLDRNVFDFLPLAPQLSTKVGAGRTGLSAAGANIRFNNFLLNGVDERAVNGNVSLGINGGKSVPLDAVKEYQLVIAPYDVRYGDFTGALINTVTRSGTNDMRGSAFAYWRSDRLARQDTSQSYERLQTGFSLGGPIRRNRIHFFIAPEIQRLTSPAPGAYLGQPTTAASTLRVSQTDVARFDNLMRGYGLEAGSGGLVSNRTNLLNAFIRVDAAVPEWNSRMVAFTSYASSEDSRFTRSARDTFYLSSYRFATAPRLRLTSLQLYTDVARIPGGHNELLISHVTDGQDFLTDVKQPVVRVTVPAIDGGVVTLTSGTAESAQGRFSENRSLSFRNEFSFSPASTNEIVLGAQAESFAIRRGGVTGGYGVWTFSNLDSLARGIPERYELRKDLGGAGAPLSGWQYGAYLGTHWRPFHFLELTGGVRADALSFSSHAAYNADVDSLFRRRTDRMPDARVHWSPRLGFTWDMSRATMLHGGIGMFTGRPPKAWYAGAITGNGVGTGVLKCGSLSADNGPPPSFVSDYKNAPNVCRTGSPIQSAPRGEVDLLDSRLRLAQTLRASLAIDHRLSRDVSASAEALMSRNRADFAFVNLNLKGPQRVDAFGRVMYGTLGPNGIAAPTLKSNFSEVIDLTNTSRNYSYEVSVRLEQKFSVRSSASAAYTWSRVRDVQSPSRVNMSGLAMWGDARAVSGRHDNFTPGISLNDHPHRFVAAVTYATPWRRAAIDLSFYYVAESGVPFTYLAYGASRRGDLNADGSSSNDPVYVPIDASQESEIMFSGRSDAPAADNSAAAEVQRIADQRAALDRFINRSVCLRRQRGLIVERNSCREPPSQTTIAGARHTFRVGSHELEASLDLFNVLNLINSRWGLYRAADPKLLEHVGQTSGTPETAQPVFRFDQNRPQWTILTTESAYQLQVGLRYRF